MSDVRRFGRDGCRGLECRRLMAVKSMKTEQCAECHGTGVSSWGQAIADNENLKAERTAATVKALELARDALTQVENLECTEDGVPVFMHSETCPSYCDYACNSKGEIIAGIFRGFREAIQRLIDAEKAQGGKHD